MAFCCSCTVREIVFCIQNWLDTGVQKGEDSLVINTLKNAANSRDIPLMSHGSE